MTLTAVLLGAILLVIGCGGMFLYRVLVAKRNLLEEINGKCRHLHYLRNSYQFDRAFTQHRGPTRASCRRRLGCAAFCSALRVESESGVKHHGRSGIHKPIRKRTQES